MTSESASRRGHPLWFLGALLMAWLGLRITTWHTPFDLSSAIARVDDKVTVPPGRARADSSGEVAHQHRDNGPVWPTLNRPLPGLVTPPLPPTDPVDAAGDVGARRYDELARSPLAVTVPAASRDDGALATARRAVRRAVLAVMSLSQLPPSSLAALLQPDPGSGPRLATSERDAGVAPRGRADGVERFQEVQVSTGTQAAPTPVAPVAPAPGPTLPRRWSADGWVLLREGDLRAPVPGQPSYGRSQAGAVLRYRLAPSSRHAPQAYARVSSALRSPRDAELAAGLSARPLAAIPVRVAAEVRVADTQGGTDVRPAAYAVTEFAPVRLPAGATGEAYLQGGYVGGDFATPFVDGQVRVARDMARVGRTSFSAGAGVWGGAQKGASRLDVGPTVAVSFNLGRIYSRLALDYRVRVAGDAEPKSGPALTLSAGF